MPSSQSAQKSPETISSHANFIQIGNFPAQQRRARNQRLWSGWEPTRPIPANSLIQCRREGVLCAAWLPLRPPAFVEGSKGFPLPAELTPTPGA